MVRSCFNDAYGVGTILSEPGSQRYTSGAATYYRVNLALNRQDVGRLTDHDVIERRSQEIIDVALGRRKWQLRARTRSLCRDGGVKETGDGK